jgi:hypothetical protein
MSSNRFAWKWTTQEQPQPAPPPNSEVIAKLEQIKKQIEELKNLIKKEQQQ